jgi:hypothetical protein
VDALVTPYRFSRFGIMVGLPATAQWPTSDLNSANCCGCRWPETYRYLEISRAESAASAVAEHTQALAATEGGSRQVVGDFIWCRFERSFDESAVIFPIFVDRELSIAEEVMRRRGFTT